MVDLRYDPYERAPHRNDNTNMSHQSIKRIQRITAHIPTIRHLRTIRRIVKSRPIREYPPTKSNINTTSIIGTVIIIIIQIARSGHTRNPRRDTQPQPENEIASDVRAGVYPSIAREEDDDVDDVPDDGEAERDEDPGEEYGVAIVEIIGAGVVYFFLDVGGWLAVVGHGCYGPGYGADGYGAEEDGEDANEEFPDEGAVVVTYCCS